MNLHELKNTHRPERVVQRVGRGPGSGRGKTSSRGHKGDKSRSGYKRRYGKEGGPAPFFQKVPTRGFSNARFKDHYLVMTLELLDTLYNDGEVVNLETLEQKGVKTRKFKKGLKVINSGELKKDICLFI